MQLKLFMLLLGCKPPGRNTEQHDVFFGIGSSLNDLLPQVSNFWKDVGKLHIDSWREVTRVDEYSVKIFLKEENDHINPVGLFFLNLGGYKPADLEEYHYKIITAAKDKAEAIKNAKQTAFYLHTGFKGAESHIDDKYGIDIDDIYSIEEILAEDIKEKYSIRLELAEPGLADDELHPGYVKLSAL